MIKRTLAYDSAFILLIALVCHFLFSKYGFNPTDEGFVLSTTNRVLHGQIPHVDFSSVRPLGYAYLHIPELLISKNRFFLVSRFVFWLEQTLVAFLWIRFLITYTKREISLQGKYSLIILCFVFNVHYFPCSVLHTIDGLLMCMIGLNIISPEKKLSFLGFLLIGFAALCKQNYLVILPVTLIFFNRKNFILNLMAGILPIAVYIGFISVHGGCNDLTTQLSGHNELLKVGILSYLTNPFLYAGLIGIFICNRIKVSKIIYASLLLISAIIILATNHYHGKYGFLFVGILAGEAIFKIYNKEESVPFLIALILAWCVSISVGYNTPGLFIGGIISILFFYSIDETDEIAKRVLVFNLLISLVTFYFVRKHNIYRDLAANKLTYKLDKIVDGADGIYTNKNTYLVLKDLDSLKKSTPKLIVIPDFTACNILHSHESKILTEWPNKTEIPNDKILQKVVSKINRDTLLVFAIPVFQTALLKDGFAPQENNALNYPVVKFVKEKHPKVSYTKYFELRSK